jgi:hypothetical protein
MSVPLFQSRPQLLQQTVLRYFAGHPGEAHVTMRPDLGGAVEVELEGQLANRFESIALPAPHDAARRQLRLLFQREYAAVAPGWELVAPGSPVLSLMLNELTSGSEYTRTAVLFHVNGDMSDLTSQGVKVHHARPVVRWNYLPRRFYLLRYLVRLICYEKTEDIVPVVLEAPDLKPAGEVLAAEVVSAPVGELDGAAYRGEVPADLPSGDELRKAIEAGDKAVQDRIRDSLQDRMADLARKLAEEQEQVRRHFEVELKADLTSAQRQELERLNAQKIQELEDRYKVKTEVALLSVQEVLAPQVEYRLFVRQVEPGSVSTGRALALSPGLVLDPVGNGPDRALRAMACSSCGQTREFACCAPGLHLGCAKCARVEKCYQPACEVAACPQHATRCGQCPQVLCQAHEKACAYCRAATRYCAVHIKKSFEGRDICPTCATACAKCRLGFPPAHIKDCNVCRKKFCTGHAADCPSCHQPFCQAHGATAQNRKETFCHNCLAACTRCAAGLRYLKADLKSCKDCRKALCASHARHCVECGQALCPDHLLETPHGTGCTGCFAPCSTCKVLERQSEMAACHLCPPGAGLHCPRHHTTCTLCAREACPRHLVRLHDGRLACKGCVAACSTCSKFFPQAETTPCQECRQPSCPAHTVASQFKAERYCSAHASAFVGCPGCGRRGPGSQLAGCSWCRLDYCPHCTGQPCRYCQALAVNAALASTWLPQAASRAGQAPLPGLTDGARSELRRALAGPAGSGYLFTCSQSRSHVLIRGAYQGGTWGFIKRWFRSVKDFMAVLGKSDGSFSVQVRQ